MRTRGNRLHGAIQPRQGCVVIGLLVVVVIALSAVVGSFRPTADARLAQAGAVAATGGQWETQVELGVGAWLVDLARLGVSFVDEVPREAREALSAVRGASVGVYERSVPVPVAGAAVLEQTDVRMLREGWDRLVGVIDGEEVVAVYVKEGTGWSGDLRCCVLVVGPREMVVVTARCNPEPLLRLAERQLQGQRMKL